MRAEEEHRLVSHEECAALSRLDRQAPPPSSLFLKNAMAAFLGVMVSLLIMATFEGVFWALNRWDEYRHPVVYTSTVTNNRLDRTLGNRLIPNTTSTQIKKIGDTTILSATYSSDSFGRRNTPRPEGAPPAHHFALFFGCSFTYGTGVANSETLPSQVAKLAPDWHVYNYAFQGYGPNHCLALLDLEDMRPQISEPDGVGVFVFIPDHVRRVVGTRKVVCTWPHGENAPCYDWTPDGGVSYRGSFESAHPWRVWFYGLLSADQFFKYFKRDFPAGTNENEKRLTAAILAAARDRFQKRFPGSRFVVAIYPDHPNPRAYPFRPQEMIPYLKAVGLEVLDYSQAIDLTKPGMTFEQDGHPTALAHEQLAPFLVRDLMSGSHKE